MPKPNQSAIVTGAPAERGSLSISGAARGQTAHADRSVTTAADCGSPPRYFEESSRTAGRHPARGPKTATASRLAGGRVGAAPTLWGPGPRPMGLSAPAGHPGTAAPGDHPEHGVVGVVFGQVGVVRHDDLQ